MRANREIGWIRVTKYVNTPFEIRIEGAENLNRAVMGDEIAVEIISEAMDVE
jgi:hypothetical protein